MELSEVLHKGESLLQEEGTAQKFPLHLYDLVVNICEKIGHSSLLTAEMVI